METNRKAIYSVCYETFMSLQLQGDGFTVGFSNQEVTAWAVWPFSSVCLKALSFVQRLSGLAYLSLCRTAVTQLYGSINHPAASSGVSTTLSDRSIAPKGGELHPQRFKATQSS
jgi:hypothetical protein